MLLKQLLIFWVIAKELLKRKDFLKSQMSYKNALLSQMKVYFGKEEEF
jgi:hypothetical protein